LSPRALNGSTEIKFVNTSMHGVGHVFVNRGFERFGFKPFIPVKEQQHPDPEFPTVKFPNPEEAGRSHILPVIDGTDAPVVIQELW
jgi:phosphomannomutase